MQIVIDIPEERYKMYKEWGDRDGTEYMNELEKGVYLGTPLPKGHGRLIDVNRLARVDHIILESTVDNAPTIIEADTESEE